MDQMMKIFYSSPVPMLIIDENNIIIKANDTFSRFVRKQPAEVEDMRVGKALSCENVYISNKECGQGTYCLECKLQGIIKEAIYNDKGIQNAEIQYSVIANGVQVRLNLRLSAIPVVIEQIKYIAVMFENLEKFKKNTSFIEESLEFFRKTFDNSLAFLWWGNIDGNCTFINSSWLKFTGRTIEEECGYGWMDRLYPDDRIMVQKSYQMAISNNSEYNIEFRALRFDGEYRWINIIVQPIYSSDGQLTGYISTGFDVTDKRLERDLLEKYKLLSENVDEIILFSDKGGNILEANNSAVKSYGYTYQELLSLNISDLIDKIHFTQNQLTNVNQKGITYELQHIRNDGSQFPVEVSINSAFINEEELYIAVIRDISKRKNAEQEMQDSEQRYYLLFTNMSEAFCYGRVVCDNKGIPVDYIVLEVNSAFEKMTGFRREELLNKRATDVNPNIKYSEPNLIRVCGNVALTGEDVKFELKMNPKGKIYNVSTYSPQLGCFVNVFTDITEQKRVELEIRKLSSALEQSSAMVIITDTTGNIEYVNSKFTNITGYSSEEISGKHISITGYENMKEKFLSEISTVISKGEGWNGEFLNKKKSGEYYWVSASISSVKDQNGVITHYTSIQEDITERKTLEKALKHNNKKLKKAVKELKSMQELLIQQEKLAGIGQLAAGVAHEINNPLGFVMSNFDTLHKYKERISKLIAEFRILNHSIKNEDYSTVVKHLQQIDELEEEIKFDYILEETNEIFNDCNEGLLRIKNIVYGLSVFVRSGQHQGFEKYDINAGIENALIIAHNKIKYHAEVQKELEDIQMIQAFGDQINQVLLNIIVNAEQAIAAKNLKSKGLIIIKTYYDNKNVYCEIIDDGIGISKENIKKIFNPFFTTKPIGQGTGLGLSISLKIIVNEHNGRLMVESEEGKGTKFTIKLPISNK